MDQLFIQIVDSAPVNHPAFESNLVQAFGGVPEGWATFTRVPPPEVTRYQVLDPAPTYALVDGVWSDVWHVRDMTPDEKTAYQQPVKDAWAVRPYATNFSAWAFDETTLTYKPPIPRPTDGQTYRWSGPDNNWKLAPPMPNDGNVYAFNFDSWAWESITQGP